MALFGALVSGYLIWDRYLHSWQHETYFSSFIQRNCEQARLPDRVAHSICVVRPFGILLIAAPLFSENLLVVDVYARIVPKGQIEPIPDPFIEAIVSGKQGPLPASQRIPQSVSVEFKGGIIFYYLVFSVAKGCG